MLAAECFDAAVLLLLEYRLLTCCALLWDSHVLSLRQFYMCAVFAMHAFLLALLTAAKRSAGTATICGTFSGF